MGGGVKRIAILGSTGSIGVQTLETIRAFSDRFYVVGLAAGRNIDLLTSQVAEFRPELVYYQAKTSMDQSDDRPFRDAGSVFLPLEDKTIIQIRLKIIKPTHPGKLTTANDLFILLLLL